MKLNEEFKICKDPLGVETSMIYIPAADENGKRKIVLHEHYPNAQKGYEDSYKVFVEV